MSVSCRPAMRPSSPNLQVLSANDRRCMRGFTLLELLVILVIVGLIAGVVAPQLSTLSDRIAFAMNREGVEHALALLPYDAFRRREDLILPATNSKGTSTDDYSTDDTSMNVIMTGDGAGDKETTTQPPVLSKRVVLSLPAGWQIESQAPILFRSTGFCTGGEVTIRVGSYAYIYKLTPPDCRPVQK